MVLEMNPVDSEFYLRKKFRSWVLDQILAYMISDEADEMTAVIVDSTVRETAIGCCGIKSVKKVFFATLIKYL